MFSRDPQSSSRLRVMLGLAGVFFVFFLAMKLRTQATTDNQGALRAIDDLLNAQVAAWNAGDLDGYLATYADSDDLTQFTGTETRQGIGEVRDYYRSQAASGMGQLALSETGIEVLGSTSACVRGRWKVARSGQTSAGLFTLVLKKQRDGWRILHEQRAFGP